MRNYRIPRSRLSKGFSVALFVSLNAAFFLLIIPGSSLQGQPSPHDNPVLRGRIDKFLAQLKTEDINQSEELLLFEGDPQFLFPGYQNNRGGYQGDLETLLSNRRAIKVLDSIQKSPAQEREAACQNLFAKAFQVHTNLFYMDMDDLDGLARKTNSSRLCSRLTLLLAMFATADAGNRVLLAKQFLQLERLKEEAKNILDRRRQDEETRIYGLFFRDSFIPDNRSQINLLYLVASREAKGPRNVLSQVQGEFERMEMPKQEIPVVPWDASTTLFDTVLLRSSRVDVSGGVTNYLFWDWRGIDGADSSRKTVQEPLIKKLRSIVFGAPGLLN